ncbi:MAG TPA: PASTA domain-containing protein, partial [Acidimicrobiales bacterium]|nr:PASTA domain-containing protein [Acidimicrobiales bacterium]
HVKSGTKIDLVLSKGRRPVPVPKVVGLTRAAARAEIVAGHLTPHSTRVYSESVAPGIVVKATPNSGTAGFGSTVSVEISRGPAPRTIPNLSGQPSTAAASALSALRLKPTESAIYSPTVPSGMVISTLPASGTVGVPVGTAVAVVVSKGPQPVAVPIVAGDAIADAVAALRAAGLNVVEQIGPPFATKATTTNPAPGSTVLPGSDVTLYVA